MERAYKEQTGYGRRKLFSVGMPLKYYENH
jgi:hypothetical protein